MHTAIDTEQKEFLDVPILIFLREKVRVNIIPISNERYKILPSIVEMDLKNMPCP